MSFWKRDWQLQTRKLSFGLCKASTAWFAAEHMLLFQKIANDVYSTMGENGGKLCQASGAMPGHEVAYKIHVFVTRCVGDLMWPTMGQIDLSRSRDWHLSEVWSERLTLHALLFLLPLYYY